MERSSTTRPPQDQEHSAGELVKMMSEQVSALTEAIEGLRQSYASAQTSDPEPAGVRTRSIRRAVGHHRRSRSHS